MPVKVVFFDIGNTLVRGEQWVPGAKDAIAKLKANRIRVGLISNTGVLSREELADRFLPADFQVDDFEQGIVFLSSEIGVEKPSLAIFSLAVQHAGVSPWETLFVGESLIETLMAQAAGMRSARILNAEVDYPELIKHLVS